MNLRFEVVREQIGLTEPVCIRILLDDQATNPDRVRIHGLRFFVNDEWEETWDPPDTWIDEVDPRTGSIVQSQANPLKLHRGRPELEAFSFQLRGDVSIGSDARPFESPRFLLRMDFRNAIRLPAPTGEPSHYFREGSRLIFATPYCRDLNEGPTKVLKVDFESLRVLSPSYVVDATRVYREGRLQKGVSASRFRVLNAIFAGNDEIILTSYGDAKVAHPPSFAVLDEGRAWEPGYRSGYGRDKSFVYYFNESVSTPHAKRVRACKNPAAFVSLPLNFGRDDDHVFREETMIDGADPTSWMMLNADYSKDAGSVYFETRRVPGADVSTFESLQRGSTFDRWAKDHLRYYFCGLPATEEQFRAQTRFVNGLQLQQDSRWSEAIEAFQDAMRLDPSLRSSVDGHIQRCRSQLPH